MKHLFSRAAIAVMAAASMASCSNESELARAKDAANAMRFRLVGRTPTKGTPTTSANYLSQIADLQVWAYFASGATGSGVTPGGRYVGKTDTEGIVIDCNGEAECQYRNYLDQQYWPATTAPLNFQAITPATDASFTIENTPSDNLSRLTAVVTVPTTTTDQKDIMFAKAENQTRKDGNTAVALAFKHGLSQVVFGGRVAKRNIEATVNSIEVVNVHAEGRIGYFAPDASLTSEVSGPASAVFSVGIRAENTLAGTNTKNLTADNGALLMLPQTVAAWTTTVSSPSPAEAANQAHNAYLRVNCTVRDTRNSTLILNNDYVYIPFEINWQQGKKYGYSIVFGEAADGYDESGNTLKDVMAVSCRLSSTAEWTDEIGADVPLPDFGGYVKATFSVADATQQVPLLSCSTSDVADMWIEKEGGDAEQTTPSVACTFPGAGNYNVYILFSGESLPDGTFSNCKALTSVTLPQGLSSIGSKAFYNCTSLGEIDIPEGVESIGGHAFCFCSGLTSITIPNSVTSIGNDAFYECTGLTEIIIPEGVASIGESAFRECSELTSISLPSTLESIGIAAFEYCTALSSIICKATTAPSTTSSSFAFVNPTGVLTVPVEATGYDEWMGYSYLKNWTKVESSEL